ncbi:MAG: glycosyl hydrolase family 16 [Ardenticatenaceae bacterium]|nr:MAG: glycosyl hydrolase family 16 [Ardenticatenaceae bacterium]
MVCKKKVLLFLLLLLAACSAATAEPTPTATPAPTPTPDWVIEGWDLVWQDEFDSDTIDSANWTHEVGGDGWGNGEAQYYTDDPKNSYIEDGVLVIEALQENLLGKLYTSARLSSQGKVEVAYGRIEARIQIPVGQSLWPAFWMLGNDIDTAGWPFSGEIDIMENIGSEPSTIHGTVHGPRYFGANGVGRAKNLPNGAQYADDFHIFAIEWEEEEVRWYMDDEMYHKITPSTVPGDWVFDHPFFLIINLAVGGEWPGYPDGTTPFPQILKVDYVRIYESSNTVE